MAQKSPSLALGIIAVEASLPTTFLYQRKHRVDLQGKALALSPYIVKSPCLPLHTFGVYFCSL
ncbi:MAG: hypothetical protein ACYDAE_29660, partial [Steroidobacteraceae bacterium]